MISDKVSGIVGAIFILVSAVYYISAILKGKTKPDLVSWTIWASLGVIGFASAASKGWNSTLWVLLINAAVQTIYALLSIKYGDKGRWGIGDIISIVACMMSVVLWYLTRIPETALFVVLVVDAYGSFRTFRKSWQSPEDEDLPAWVLGGAGDVFSILAIEKWNFLQVGYPLYLGITVPLIALVIFVRKPR